jgi:hypothetical protein
LIVPAKVSLVWLVHYNILISTSLFATACLVPISQELALVPGTVLFGTVLATLVPYGGFFAAGIALHSAKIIQSSNLSDKNSPAVPLYNLSKITMIGHGIFLTVATGLGFLTGNGFLEILGLAEQASPMAILVCTLFNKFSILLPFEALFVAWYLRKQKINF